MGSLPLLSRRRCVSRNNSPLIVDLRLVSSRFLQFTSQRMFEDFVIYRPEKTTHRLEGTYHQDQRYWRPSLSYEHKLDDIRNQFTPAESFRYALATSGKYIRMIQRLELRWNRNYTAFVNAATKIQSLHRGNVSRAYYAQIKQELYIELKRRQAKAVSSAFFLKKEYEECVDEVDRNLPGTAELLAIKMKAQYRLQRLKECVLTSEEIVEMDPLQEEAYYIQACCWVSLHDLDNAYAVMKRAAIQIEAPTRNTLSICAYIAAKINPPRYMEAVDSITAILKSNPHDYEALLERACAFFCLQEWSAGIKDLTFVLVFVPTHIKALLMRARAHACTRRWDLSRTDYTTVLMHQPGNEAALAGLKDIQDTVIVLPMMGDDLIANESY